MARSHGTSLYTQKEGQRGSRNNQETHGLGLWIHRGRRRRNLLPHVGPAGCPLRGSARRPAGRVHNRTGPQGLSRREYHRYLVRSGFTEDARPGGRPRLVSQALRSAARRDQPHQIVSWPTCPLAGSTLLRDQQEAKPVAVPYHCRPCSSFAQIAGLLRNTRVGLAANGVEP